MMVATAAQPVAEWIQRLLAARMAHVATGLTLSLTCWAGYTLWLRDALPPTLWMAGHVAYALKLLLWFGGLAVIRHAARHGWSPRVNWSRLLLAVVGFDAALEFLVFWIALPVNHLHFGLLTVMFAVAQIALRSLMTVQPPGLGRRLRWILLAPIGIALGYALLFLLRSPMLNNVLILMFLACFTIAALSLREYVQAGVERTHAALRLAEQQRDAQRAARERFIASAGHDLEQPLQAARLSLYHAQRSDDPARRADAYRRMDWAFGAMEAMVSQIMDHLKFDHSAVISDVRPTRLGPHMAHQVSLHQDSARAKGVALRLLPTRLCAHADHALLDRALGNLIANAIRHAKARRILIAARRKGTAVRIWVIDDGVGVGEDDRARLFEAYTQGDHRGEVRGGYGLGLASAQSMAEAMGGRVGQEPRWMHGSAFFLELRGL